MKKVKLNTAAKGLSSLDQDSLEKISGGKRKDNLGFPDTITITDPVASVPFRPILDLEDYSTIK